MTDGAVALTGIGTVNALGAGGRTALASALASGRSGAGPLRAFDPGDLASRLAAEVDEASIADGLDADGARRLSRICRLAVAACRLAVADAGVARGPDLGVVVGSEHGDFRSSVGFVSGYLARGPGGLSPLTFPSTVMNTMAAAAAIDVDARAVTVTVNEATVAGELAVARGVALIRSGHARAVVAGGVDEIFEPVHRQLARLGALAPMRGRRPEGAPRAPGRDGPVPGEGATFVVLEDPVAARARDAPVLALVTLAAWGGVPAAPHAGGRTPGDAASPVARLLRGPAGAGVVKCYGAANGDPLLHDWEEALLRADLGAGAERLLPPVTLAAAFGQHGGLGALRVGAAALDAAGGVAPVLVHGLARSGCRTALVLDRP